MVIWILDFCSGYCTKVHLTKEKEKEIKRKFRGDVGEFLSKHQQELGVRYNDILWMLTYEDKYDEMVF